jgi:two-component system sensor histidine kinase VicK
MNQTYSIQAIKDIANLSSDGVCIYDFENKEFLFANAHFMKIVETTQDEMDTNRVGLIERWVADDSDYAHRYYNELLSVSKVEDIEFKFQGTEGEKILSVSAFLLNNKNILVTCVKNVTSGKEHFNYIVEFGARKDALLDMVAHNLSGPLNLTTELLNAVDQLHKNQQFQKIDSFNRLIRESTQQCIEIINSFLEEEHSESERVVVKRNLFNPNTKVTIVVDRIKQFNRDKQFELFSSHDDVTVRADDVKFFQIVHNLISNAVKFTPPQGAIRVELLYLEEFFELTVADSGIGIPEHLQPYVFLRNTPASREGLKGEKSIGMGLYIIKKLTEMMRGAIFFRSEENVGTTFTLRFPRG